LLIAIGSGVSVETELGVIDPELPDFHRPHPGKEAKPYQVRAAREFLEQMEVKP